MHGVGVRDLRLQHPKDLFVEGRFGLVAGRGESGLVGSNRRHIGWRRERGKKPRRALLGAMLILSQLGQHC
jgi:hypothetical protein